jgi:ADP-ribosylglycohydrolase
MHPKNNFSNLSKTRSLLLGVAVGDALGVPVEFMSRAHLDENPMTDITGWGTYEQPPGTFSDDTSLTMCLAESMAEGLDIVALGNKMCDWYRKGYWSADGEVFDIGIGTRIALQSILNGTPAVQAGGTGEKDNGNGSLMRIAPLALDPKLQDLSMLWSHVQAVSSITHQHIRSHIACFIWLVYLQEIIAGIEKTQAYQNMREKVNKYFDDHPLPQSERELFFRILQHNIADIDRTVIRSGGYVVETLEAALWTFLNTDTYKSAILTGINLGHDTDTTAAVIGSAAGIYYTEENIPSNWLAALAKKNEIENLAERLYLNLSHEQ